MSLEQFITDLLNVKAGDIQEIYHLKQSDQSLILKVKLKRCLLSCPFCGKKLNIHGYYTRKLTHSTFANRKCSIHYMQRRYKCENCKITIHEQNPFSSSRESITHETKINVLTDLKYTEATYTSVASRYNLSTTQVIRIFDKHINIPRKPLPEVLSIDEHYFPESDYDSLCCCLLMDFITG
jgi:transposase